MGTKVVLFCNQLTQAMGEVWETISVLFGLAWKAHKIKPGEIGPGYNGRQ